MVNDPEIVNQEKEFFEKKLDELVCSAKKGSKEDFDEIFSYCGGLIYSIILPFIKKGILKYVEYDDLNQEACLGLLDAIKRFDARKDSKFISYATIRIRGSIVDYLRNISKLPRSVVLEINWFSKVEDILEQELLRKPAIAEIFNYAESKGRKINTKSIHFSEISIDEVIIEHFCELHYEDTTVLDRERIIQIEKVIKIIRECPVLDDQEKKVVLKLYLGQETLRDLGKDFGVSESRICQIRASGIKKLTKHFRVTHNQIYSFFKNFKDL